MTHPPAPAFAAPPRALRGGPRSPQSGMRRPAPVTPSAPLSQPRAVPLTLTQTRDRDAVPERAAMPREMTGYYRAEVQVGGCFVGIAAGRPSSSGSGYTDLVYFIRPGSPKRKQFRPGKNPARRRLAWLQCLAARPGARKGRDLARGAPNDSRQRHVALYAGLDRYSCSRSPSSPAAARRWAVHFRSTTRSTRRPTCVGSSTKFALWRRGLDSKSPQEAAVPRCYTGSVLSDLFRK